MNARERRISEAMIGLKQALSELAVAPKTSPGIFAPLIFGKVRGNKMTEFEIEMRGRLIMLETFIATMLAHTAAHISDPTQFTAQVIADVEYNLDRTLEATEGAQKQSVEFARIFLHSIWKAMLTHVARHVPPEGQG